VQPLARVWAPRLERESLRAQVNSRLKCSQKQC